MGDHFQTIEIKERYATLVSAKPEKLKHEINKNWHGSSLVIRELLNHICCLRFSQGCTLRHSYSVTHIEYNEVYYQNDVIRQRVVDEFDNLNVSAPSSNKAADL